MHSKLLVTIKKEEGKTDEQYRDEVQEYLETEGFCEDTRFAHGWASNFTVGGVYEIDQVIYDKYLAQHADRIEFRETSISGSTSFIDKDMDMLSPAVVGTKKLVLPLNAVLLKHVQMFL